MPTHSSNIKGLLFSSPSTSTDNTSEPHPQYHQKMLSFPIIFIAVNHLSSRLSPPYPFSSLPYTPPLPFSSPILHKSLLSLISSLYQLAVRYHHWISTSFCFSLYLTSLPLRFPPFLSLPSSPSLPLPPFSASSEYIYSPITQGARYHHQTTPPLCLLIIFTVRYHHHI